LGKNILVQRRGRGYFIFKAPTHRRIHPVGYNSVNGHSSGYVKDLLHEMARGAPLALLKVEEREKSMFQPQKGSRLDRNCSSGLKFQLRSVTSRPLEKCLKER